MDNSFFNSKTGMDLNDIIMEEISPYDNSYPIHFFANGLKDSLRQAEKAAKDIYRMVLNEVPIAEQIKQANKKGFRLVVDTTDSMLDAIDKGKIKVSIVDIVNKNGASLMGRPIGRYITIENNVDKTKEVNINENNSDKIKEDSKKWKDTPCS